MKKALLLVITLVMMIAVATSCGKYIPGGTTSPGGVPTSSISTHSGFNFIFKYGITAGNEINTYEGTFIKDMISAPSIMIDLTLTEQEMDSIYQKMVEIDFFSYPDEFKITVSEGELIGMVTPFPSYYFTVEKDSIIKNLRWDDEITNPDVKADRLRELISLIKGIIESKEEYKALPTPSGGYM